ncbi:MAG: STAS domain-containing protein [Sulfuricella sp.]|nr:STAS domain-containing protein [Sulfuricella sp.]
MNNPAQQLRPEGEMTIFTAADLKEQLIATLSASPELEIDLSQVSEMDSAGLQLLIAAKNECLARNGRLRLTGHSPAVREVLDICNMTAFFGDPVVIPSCAQ